VSRWLVLLRRHGAFRWVQRLWPLRGAQRNGLIRARHTGGEPRNPLQRFLKTIVVRVRPAWRISLRTEVSCTSWLWSKHWDGWSGIGDFSGPSGLAWLFWGDATCGSPNSTGHPILVSQAMRGLEYSWLDRLTIALPNGANDNRDSGARGKAQFARPVLCAVSVHYCDGRSAA
jgi:hypothetical protein